MGEEGQGGEKAIPNATMSPPQQCCIKIGNGGSHFNVDLFVCWWMNVTFIKFTQLHRTELHTVTVTWHACITV